jgi:hypothetical protein
MRLSGTAPWQHTAAAFRAAFNATDPASIEVIEVSRAPATRYPAATGDVLRITRCHSPIHVDTDWMHKSR